ncbi:hypothetical protein HDU81_002378 [Chytriomyces hyalinus]|nr:hypothetical protein HDU81_002378 [Chytriomyces hyalinus]
MATTNTNDPIHSINNAVVLTINDTRNRDGSATTEATLKQPQAALDSQGTTKPDFISDAQNTNNSTSNANTNNNASKDFSVTPESLSAFISPHKDHAALAAMGHIAGVMSMLRVDEAVGLSTAAHGGNLETRERVFGANRLPAVPPKSIFYFMLKALSDKIMILLSVVALVSLAIGIYEDVTATDPAKKIHWIEGFSVLVAVIIIVLVTSINDLNKERQFRNLNAKKEDRKIKGIRDGNTQLISIYDILVGDVLLLEPGDVVAADGVFISGMGLKCDESSATGESDAIKKGGTHDPFILSGSKVTEGIGKYVVTAVGEHSYFGKIMMAMRTENEDTPLQVKLDGLAERIAKLGTAFAILLFVLLFLKYIVSVLKTHGFGNATEAQESGSEVASQLVKILLTSIAIVAVAVPEGLPLAVTLSLAYATVRMMKDNNLVRVLSACETMGNATTICSDKTGTLTQNKMTVVAGVVGKNAMFAGDDEMGGLKQKVAGISSSNSEPVQHRVEGDVDETHPVIVVPPAEIAPVVSTGSSSTSKSGKQPGPSGPDLLNRIMECAALNSSAFEAKNEATGEIELIGSKTEVALLQWADKAGFDYKQLRSNPNHTIVQVYPFSSERKSMATLVKVNKGDGTSPVYRIYAKGAPEVVMKYCDKVVLVPFSASPTAIKNQANFSNETPSPIQKRLATVPTPGSRSNPHGSIIYPLETKLRTDYSAIIEHFALQSLRTICLAYREFSGEEFDALMNGTLKERVLAAKRVEKEHDKNKDSNEDGILRDPSPSPSEKLLESANALAGANTLGSSLLMIPQAQGSSHLTIGSQGAETKSFIESHLSEEDLVTESDILSHPLAFEQIVGQGLVMASVVGIEDPLRPGVVEAVRACKDAGVFVRMVTGDNVMTAKSIATQCGIYQRGGLVMEGEHFRKLSPERMLQVIPRLQVLARSSPLDKQILVSMLKQLGETVAVTGDGTNDGPALKMADIGFSMGIAGTEVAKEASSIILMDDSFSSVVKAILWGRSVNDSVKKFLQFQLSVNISAVLITLISALVDSDESSALTVVQLLWVNLVMDTLAALALATELPTNELLQRPPESRKAPLISFTMWKMILGQAMLQIAINLILLFAGPYLFNFQALINAGGVNGSGSSEGEALEQKKVMKTVVFNTFVILQLFSLVNSRRIDNNVNVFVGILRNPPFYLIFIGVAAVQAILVEFGSAAFQTVHLSGIQWLVCIIAGSLTLPWGIILRLIPNDAFRLFGVKMHDETAYHDMIDVQSGLDALDPNTAGGFMVSTTPEEQTRGRTHTTTTTTNNGGGGIDAISTERGLTPATNSLTEPSNLVGRRRTYKAHVSNMKEKLEHMNLKVYSFVRGGLRRRENMDGGGSDGTSSHPSQLVVNDAAGGGRVVRRK